MSNTEWANLQEALIYCLYPMLQLLMALLFAGSMFAAISMLFARAVRWMTRPKIS